MAGGINLINQISELVCQLRDDYGACSLKLGTEAEGNTFSDIEYMYRQLNHIIPIIVKVGGCEAKNDIRKMSEVGISGIVGPMIESPYALSIFIKTMQNYYNSLDEVSKIINVESITAFENLGKILQSPFFDNVDQVTIGRSDFSASLGLNVDDDKVYNYVREIVRACHKAGKVTSVGGGITPKNAMKIKEFTGTDKINIRTVVIELSKCSDIFEAIKKSLQLEILILNNNIEIFPHYSNYFENRIKVIKKRIAC
ncbi:MAG: aldolase/citrate lyase family protein [Candidatus Muiribacteriota bacterium]